MRSDRSRTRRALFTRGAVALLACTALAAVGCGPEPVPPPPPLPPVLIPPLNDAQLGEELVLRRADGQEHHYAVVRATDPEVEVEERVYSDGELRSTRRLIWNRNGFGAPGNAVIRRIERARVEAGGRTWECWVMHLYTRQGRFIAYIDDAVPVHGLIKMVRLDGGRPDERYALEIVVR